MERDLDLTNALAAEIRALASILRDMGGWLVELEDRIRHLEQRQLVGTAETADVSLLDDALVVLEGGGAVGQMSALDLSGAGTEAHQPA
jgi:hypothetical protein